MDADDLAVGGDDRAAGVARLSLCVVLDDRVDRRPLRLAVGLGLGDYPSHERELGVAEREARDADLEARVDLSVVPAEGRVAVAVEVDDREVVALRDSEHLGVDRVVLTRDEDLERRCSGDHVVVRHCDAGRVDDEAGPGTGLGDLLVGRCLRRLRERPLGNNLDDRALDAVERVDLPRPGATPVRRLGGVVVTEDLLVVAATAARGRDKRESAQRRDEPSELQSHDSSWRAFNDSVQSRTTRATSGEPTRHRAAPPGHAQRAIGTRIAPDVTFGRSIPDQRRSATVTPSAQTLVVRSEHATRRPGETGERQLRLIRGPRPDWSLDTRTRRIGRRGVAEAKAILGRTRPADPASGPAEERVEDATRGGGR